MKKKIMSVLVAAMMVAATAVPAFAADTVKIGVYEPASGDNGAGGKQETLGVQYANSVTPTVEIDGKEYDVELDIVDNESSNDKGPSAAAQLVSDKVSIVLGSMVQVYLLQHLIFSKMVGFRHLESAVPTRRSHRETHIISVSASLIRSRVLYLPTLQKIISVQRKLMYLPNLAMTILLVWAITSPKHLKNLAENV